MAFGHPAPILKKKIAQPLKMRLQQSLVNDKQHRREGAGPIQRRAGTLISWFLFSRLSSQRQLDPAAEVKRQCGKARSRIVMLADQIFHD
jgi:hypothetical protein